MISAHRTIDKQFTNQKRRLIKAFQLSKEVTFHLRRIFNLKFEVYGSAWLNSQERTSFQKIPTLLGAQYAERIATGRSVYASSKSDKSQTKTHGSNGNITWYTCPVSTRYKQAFRIKIAYCVAKQSQVDPLSFNEHKLINCTKTNIQGNISFQQVD